MPPVILIPNDFMGRRAIGYCGICEVPYYRDRDVRAHLRSREHEEAVEAAVFAEARRRNRISFIYDDPDPEVTEHLKRVGERMLREGRMVVKKNERAGFS